MTLRLGLVAVAVSLLGVPARGQAPDPANLMGERVSAPSLADDLPINHGAPALQQLLLKLRTRASMMLIVAHPDDEDGGFLTYESRGQGARVAMLTLTRGEGGQNLMSADFNDALGLIRTQELLAADRYMGVDQFFGTEVDFGFSKTKEESFEKWVHERVLYDAVRAVRLYRPLVLASVFVGGVTDGHGHHQVAGEIAQEVFVAAADPKVFPEMGLPPWAPLKVYARVPFSRVTDKGMYDYATGQFSAPRFHNYVTGTEITQEPAPTVTIHEGDPGAAEGLGDLSFVQFARQGLALQKTQIGEGVRLASPGRYDVGYTLMASRLACPADATVNETGCPTLPEAQARQKWATGRSGAPASESGLFEGIDTTLFGLTNVAPDADGQSHLSLQVTLQKIDRTLQEAQEKLDPANMGAIAPNLRTALSLLDGLLADVQTPGKWSVPADERYNLLHELRIKRRQLNDALVLSLGLQMTARAESTPARPDGSLTPGAAPKLEIAVSGLGAARLREVVVNGPEGQMDKLLPDRRFADSPTAAFEVVESIPGDAPVTRPYFSRQDIEQATYTLSDPALRNAPATPAVMLCVARLDYDGVALEVRRQVSAEGTKNAISIVPKLSVSVAPSVGIEPATRVRATPIPVAVQVVSEAPVGGGVRLEAPAGWASEPLRAALPAAPVGTATMLKFNVMPGAAAPDGRYRITAAADAGGRKFEEGFRRVAYAGLPYTNFYRPAVYRGTVVDVTTAPGLKVGYLPGTGDAVPEFLPSLGVTPVILTVADLNAAKLAGFDAVVIGVRAYAAHPELAGAGSAPLLAYAEGGGVVVVQYMTAGFGDAESPAAIRVPGDPAHNVVVEAQPVVLLKPSAPLLTWPNKITAKDFDGWVEERGHGFAASWGTGYEALLEVHDPEQDPQRGGLLVAKTGKGAYIYCALALYRQLPEGVGGAYRLMANLLSYGKNPER